MANPLTGLLRKGFLLNGLLHARSSSTTSTLLCSTRVLSAPRFDRAFKLEVDVSSTGAGAVLIQADDAEHPISFFFNTFLNTN